MEPGRLSREETQLEQVEGETLVPQVRRSLLDSQLGELANEIISRQSAEWGSQERGNQTQENGGGIPIMESVSISEIHFNNLKNNKNVGS